MLLTRRKAAHLYAPPSEGTMLLLVVHILLGSNCQVTQSDHPTKTNQFYAAVARVPSFFTRTACASDDTAHVEVFARRSTSKRTAEIRWAKAGEATSGYCIPLVFEPGHTCPRGVLPMIEDGYEEKAFVVVERRGHWVRIALDDGTGWIRLSKADEVVDYFDLVADRQAVMTSAWDGRIRSRPGGLLLTLPRVEKQYVTVVDSRRVGGRLWFKVKALADSPCESQEPGVLVTGWVRAYSDKRQPTVYHFSRGC